MVSLTISPANSSVTYYVIIHVCDYGPARLNANWPYFILNTFDYFSNLLLSQQYL